MWNDFHQLIGRLEHTFKKTIKVPEEMIDHVVNHSFQAYA
jgi:hypothetical protein